MKTFCVRKQFTSGKLSGLVLPENIQATEAPFVAGRHYSSERGSFYVIGVHQVR